MSSERFRIYFKRDKSCYNSFASFVITNVCDELISILHVDVFVVSEVELQVFLAGVLVTASINFAEISRLGVRSLQMVIQSAFVGERFLTFWALNVLLWSVNIGNVVF